MQVFGGFIVYSPQTDGAGGWRWVGDFFTKMDEGGEKGEEEERRYSVTVVTVFRGGVYELGLLSNCYYYI